MRFPRDGCPFHYPAKHSKKHKALTLTSGQMSSCFIYSRTNDRRDVAPSSDNTRQIIGCCVYCSGSARPVDRVQLVRHWNAGLRWTDEALSRSETQPTWPHYRHEGSDGRQRRHSWRRYVRLTRTRYNCFLCKSNQSNMALIWVGKPQPSIKLNRLLR